MGAPGQLPTLPSPKSGPAQLAVCKTSYSNNSFQQTSIISVITLMVNVMLHLNDVIVFMIVFMPVNGLVI